jgi:hypothetical protein
VTFTPSNSHNATPFTLADVLGEGNSAASFDIIDVGSIGAIDATFSGNVAVTSITGDGSDWGTGGGDVDTQGGDVDTDGGDIDTDGGSIDAGLGSGTFGDLTMESGAFGGLPVGTTIRIGAGVPAGAPVTPELPLAYDTTPVTGGFYFFNYAGPAWVKVSTIL